MSDEHLRDLERQAAQGDIKAQARLLLERVRVGNLDRKMLELAAYCGDATSRLALGDEAPDTAEPQNKAALQNLVQKLAHWGRQLIIPRANISVARLALPIYEQEGGGYEARNLVVTAEHYLHHVCNEIHHKASVSWFNVAMRAAHFEAVEVARTSPHFEMNDRARMALDVARFTALQIGNRRFTGTLVPMRYASDLFEAQMVYRAIFGSLIPWALGISDPILDDPTNLDFRDISKGTD